MTEPTKTKKYQITIKTLSDNTGELPKEEIEVDYEVEKKPDGKLDFKIETNSEAASEFTTILSLEKEKDEFDIKQWIAESCLADYRSRIGDFKSMWGDSNLDSWVSVERRDNE